MGMFDRLRAKYPLPTPEHQDRTFQTKSLDRYMDDYCIEEDGRLTCRKGAEEPKPVDYTGVVAFGDVTYQGEDIIAVEFVAWFEKGLLTNLDQLPDEFLGKRVNKV